MVFTYEIIIIEQTDNQVDYIDIEKLFTLKSPIAQKYVYINKLSSFEIKSSYKEYTNESKFEIPTTVNINDQLNTNTEILQNSIKKGYFIFVNFKIQDNKGNIITKLYNNIFTINNIYLDKPIRLKAEQYNYLYRNISILPLVYNVQNIDVILNYYLTVNNSLIPFVNIYKGQILDTTNPQLNTENKVIEFLNKIYNINKEIKNKYLLNFIDFEVLINQSLLTAKYVDEIKITNVNA
ncbi:MAG: hypothetical protein ORN58_05225, partial [Sediminibacterium sp.]|nr:hypothetical protein [Sediminibacterium sp.]